MDLRRRSAAALAGLVLLLGGVAAGCSTQSPDPGQGVPGQGGPGGGFQFDTSALVTALAKELGLDETEVKTAVDDAMASLGNRGGRPEGVPSELPSERPTDLPSAPPSGMPEGDPDGGQFTEQIAKTIASALGADEETVLKIVQANLPTGGMGRGPGSGNGNR